MSLNRWGDRNWAAVSVYADLLVNFLIVISKENTEISTLRWWLARWLSSVMSCLKLISPEQIKPLLYCLDQELKSNGVNPGTTADMIVATVLTVFLEDLISNNAVTNKASNGIC